MPGQVRAEHVLSVVWPLPPLRRGYYRYATYDYISHLLGHEV
jgi:hypothetical protein